MAPGGTTTVGAGAGATARAWDAEEKDVDGIFAWGCPYCACCCKAWVSALVWRPVLTGAAPAPPPAPPPAAAMLLGAVVAGAAAVAATAAAAAAEDTAAAEAALDVGAVVPVVGLPAGT